MDQCWGWSKYHQRKTKRIFCTINGGQKYFLPFSFCLIYSKKTKQNQSINGAQLKKKILFST